MGIAHAFPLLDQAGVDLANHKPQVGLHLAHRIVLGGVGDSLGQDLVNAVEMAEQEALRTLKLVDLDVVRKGPELLEHLPGDGLGADVLLADPRVFVREGIEGFVHELATRFGVLQLIQPGHAFVVLDAFLFPLGHLAVLHLVELSTKDDLGVLENGLDEGDEVEGVVGCLRVEVWKGLEEVERERLIHREVVLKIHVHPESMGMGREGRVGIGWDEFDDVPFEQGSE